LSSASMKRRFTRRFSTGSTTRFTIERRDMSTSARWESNLPRSGIAAELAKNQRRNGFWGHPLYASSFSS
jgi:hypothetical protein